MKYSCDIIKDLLPLYVDGVCSEDSTVAVAEHLSACKSCTAELESLRKSWEIEKVIDKERFDALSSQASFFKRRSAVVGTVFAGVFMLPVLICLIIGLASGGLSWVMIVLAAMLIPASLVAVPLLAPKNKALWTLGSFSVSLTVLLAVCCIYTGGNWFFTAAFASLLGIALFFAPFAVKAKPIAVRIGKRKGLSVMLLDTGLYILMMLSIGLSNGLGADYYRIAFSVSTPILAAVWGIFLTVRYAKTGGTLKAAISFGIAAAAMIISDIIFGVSEKSSYVFVEAFGGRVELSSFTAIAVICLSVGAILALIGVLISRKGAKAK